MTPQPETEMMDLLALLSGGLVVLMLSYAASRVLKALKHGFSIRLQLFTSLFFTSLWTTALIGLWAIQRIEARAAQLFEQSGLSAEVFQEFLRDFGPKMSIILGLITLISAGSAWALGRGVAQPIERLAQSAEEIAHGGGIGTLPEPTGREVRRLTGAFVAMHRSLEDRQRFERFIADLSHDLKNPVAAIRASSEVLLSGAGEEPEARLRFLMRIDEAGGRLDRLLSHFLHLAKLEARGFKADVNPLDFMQISRRALTAFEGPAEVKEVTLELFASEGDEPLELCLARSRRLLKGNRLWLTRAIENLISNALRYTKPRGHIRLSWYADDMRARLFLRVEDDGPGVADHVQETLFERFVSDEASTLKEGEGSGLGLAIVKRVIEAHGGEIVLIESKGDASLIEGRPSLCGAIFELWIPLDAIQEEGTSIELSQ